MKGNEKDVLFAMSQKTYLILLGSSPLIFERGEGGEVAESHY